MKHFIKQLNSFLVTFLLLTNVSVQASETNKEVSLGSAITGVAKLAVNDCVNTCWTTRPGAGYCCAGFLCCLLGPQPPAACIPQATTCATAAQTMTCWNYCPYIGGLYCFEGARLCCGPPIED